MLAIASPKRELGTRAEARERELERCLKMNPTYILMIDDDQTMPIRGLNAMLASGADVAVIDAPAKDLPSSSNIRYHPNGELYSATISCCAIKAEIFAKLEKPWFSSKFAIIEDRIVDGKIISHYEEKYQDDNIGEDIFFIRKVIEAGFSVKVMPNLKCNHFNL